MAGPQHTYEITSLFISTDDKIEFIQQYKKLFQEEGKLSAHWIDRLMSLNERVEGSTALLLVGFKQKNRPIGMDCGACNYEKCEDFFKNNMELSENPLCPIELMSFGSAISRGLQLANQLQIANLLTQSLGRAALALGWIEGEFAVGILLEVGQNVKTAKENKMEIKME